MSGVIKTVKKAFKKIVKVVKKIIKPVAIAVAAYFTAGLALSAIPATASFAASLPGFAGGGILGTGIGAGATAGTGIFTKAASAIGLGGGLTGSSAAQAAAAASSGSSAAALSASGGSGAFGGAFSGPGAAAAKTGAGAAAGGAAGGGGAAMLAGGAKAGMSLTDKLLLAKTGVDVAGALFGPTEEDLIEENAKWRGAFYGMEAGGEPLPAIGSPQPPQPGGDERGQVGATDTQSGAISADAQQLREGRQKADSLFQIPESSGYSMQGDDEGSPELFGQGQMKQHINIPDNVYAPARGVRYV